MPAPNPSQRQDKSTGRRPTKGPDPRQQLPQNLWFWWLIFAALLAWNLFAWWPSHSTFANIPYSTFLAQVTSNNISRVHIVGDNITGQFVKPLLWPPPKQGKQPAKSAAPQASPTPAPSKQPGTHPEATGKSQGPPGQAQNPPAPVLYHEFRTFFPSVVGDPNLIALLEAHHVTINVSSSSANSWLASILINWVPILLLIGFFWWIAGRGSRAQSGMFGFGRMRARRYSAEQPRITFADVAGADEAKAELQEEVDFLAHPGKYRDMGARIPKGVLL
ncbi:MAG TPA: ATP-dependent metallopeptidase FtsH/Yme1/Tma family protein, partial [Candidatus Binataceae bacterium]|nr:ATP-dependent metallopeptidase FtsH/Yme1/Tma family protein [Candidatus Binataceae bacterium]